MERKGNWIGPWERPSKEGLFELRARLGGSPILGEWPRSGAQEVVDATEAMAAGALQPVLERAIGERAFDLGNLGLDSVAARLGLHVDEAALFFGQGPRWQFGLGLDEGIPTGTSGMWGFALLVAGATMLPNELIRLAISALAAGRPVLIVAHENLPMCADLARQRLVEAGVQPAALSVLHGLTPAGWCELGKLEPKLEIMGQLDMTSHADLLSFVPKSPGLGRLLGRLADPLEVRLDLSSFARNEALLGVALGALAERLVECAFGRGQSLGGQASRAPLSVSVPGGLYAEFVDATLAAIEARCQFDDPVAWWGGKALARRYQAAWRGALDEGAVLLHGGEVVEQAGEIYPSPTLLVNLPLASRAFLPREPLGQLRLARALERH